MQSELNLSMYEIIKKYQSDITDTLVKVRKIYNILYNVENVLSALKHINSIILSMESDKDLYSLGLLENGELIINLLFIIKQQLIIISESENYTGVHLSQSDIKEVEQLLIKLIYEYKVVNNACQNYKVESTANVIESTCMNIIGTDTSKNNKKIFDRFKDFVKLSKSYKYTWKVYTEVYKRVATVLTTPEDQQNLVKINEELKSYILNTNTITEESRDKINTLNLNANPYLKTFGLIPSTGIMSMNEIEKILKTQKKCDLIILTKDLDRGINYNIMDLLDFGKSKEFGQSNTNDSGINKPIISRYTTIQYIADTKKYEAFKVKYTYKIQSDAHLYVLVAEELFPGNYHILVKSQKTDPINFILKSDVSEFIEFVNNIKNKSSTQEPSRIDNYNKISEKKILNNMFLGKVYDIRDISDRITSEDITFFKYNIFTDMSAKYKTLSIKPIKNIFEFSRILHSPEFVKIFSKLITDKYSKYLTDTYFYKQNQDNNVIAELYMSFLNHLNMYESDFGKKIHDQFVNNIDAIIKDDIFASKTYKTVEEYFQKLFDKIIKSVIRTIITYDCNIFQNLFVKNKLFNLSMIGQ